MKKYIYKIQNKTNNKCYIGQSKDYIVRWRQHKTALNRNGHDNIHLQHSWNKYGEDNFEFSVINYGTNYNFMEKYYIELYDSMSNGYNLLYGGENPPIHKGETSHKAKLKQFEVDDIQKLLLKHTDKNEIQNKYKTITVGQINKINNGKAWHNENLNYPLSVYASGSYDNLIDETIEKIINDLFNTRFTQKQIAEKYNVARSTVTNINIGYIENTRRDNIDYPIRKKSVAYYSNKNQKLIYYN